MERMPKMLENNAENAPNFHEVSEKRRELRKAISELGDKGVIFEKHYKKPLEEADQEAGDFKVADFGGTKGAKEALRKQKSEYEKEVLENGADVDYETILKNTPEISEVQKVMENIADLKDFRMRRMFEILDSRTSLPAKKRNEAVLKTIKEEIRDNEEKLEQTNPLVLRQAKLVEYKENLGQSGHICITPRVEKYLERLATGCSPASRCFYTDRPAQARHLWPDLPLGILPARIRRWFPAIRRPRNQMFGERP